MKGIFQQLLCACLIITAIISAFLGRYDRGTFDLLLAFMIDSYGPLTKDRNR